MNNFDIGITTFSLRYDYVESLIKSIRTLNVENNIFLCINGEKNSDFSEEYREKIITWFLVIVVIPGISVGIVWLILKLIS